MTDRFGKIAIFFLLAVFRIAPHGFASERRDFQHLDLGLVGNVEFTPNGLENIIEKIFNLNREFIEKKILATRLSDLPIARGQNASGPFKHLDLHAEGIKVEHIKFSKIKAACDTSLCKVWVQIKELELVATLGIQYPSSQIKKNIRYELRPQSVDQLPMVNVTATIAFNDQASKVLSINRSLTRVTIPESCDFSIQMGDTSREKTTLRSLIFNLGTSNRLIEKALNDYAIGPAIAALRNFIKGHRDLNQYLYHYVETGLPNFDVAGIVDVYYIRKIHGNIQSMLDAINADRQADRQADNRRPSQLVDYFALYRSYIEKYQLFSQEIMSFLEAFKAQALALPDFPTKIHLVNEIDRTQKYSLRQAMKSAKRSFLKFEFPNPSLVQDPELLQMSLFLTADKSKRSEFVNVRRHGRLYSADEHKIIGGLAAGLRLFKLGEHHKVKKAQSAKVRSFLLKFHDQWVATFRSVHKLPSRHFLRTVNSLVTALKEHVEHCENRKHRKEIEKIIERFELGLKWASDASTTKRRAQHDFRLTIPIGFINKFLNEIFLNDRFSDIHIKTNDRDILLDPRRDLKLSLKSPPQILWDKSKSKFSLVIRNLEASIFLAGRVRLSQSMGVNFHFVPDLNERGQVFFKFTKVDGEFSYLPEKNDRFLKKIKTILSLSSIISPAIKISIISPLVYAQINAIFNDFWITLPNFPITSHLSLSQKLTAIKYNNEHFLVDGVIEDLYFR